MFKLVERPTIAPARSLTGGTVGPMVDTEIILHGGGRPYITEIEAGEIVKFFPAQIELRAEQLGWMSPLKVAELEAEITELREALAEADAGVPRVVAYDDLQKLLASQTPAVPQQKRAA